MVEKYSMIIIYFGILIFLGYRASKRVKSMSDFVVGGKSLAFGLPRFLRRQRANPHGYCLVSQAWARC